MSNIMIKMLLFQVLGLKIQPYSQSFTFLVLGLRSYVLGLKFLQSQPQNCSGVGSLTPECTGVLGFTAHPWPIGLKGIHFRYRRPAFCSSSNFYP